MRINLNEIATVTLTATGSQIYNDWMDQFPHNLRDHVQTGDIIRIELWNLMQIFGSSIYMGMPQVPFAYNSLDLPDVPQI